MGPDGSRLASSSLKPAFELSQEQIDNLRDQITHDLADRVDCRGCFAEETLDGLLAEIERLQEAAAEAVEWLESRPDFTEGDAATASRLRSVLGNVSEGGGG